MYIKLFTILWIIVLFLFTCTKSFDGLINDGLIQFSISSEPNLTELYQFDFHFDNKTWVLQKAGHLFGFGLLGASIYFWTRERMHSIMISTMYAILTELMQLKFTRDGRIMDIVIDVLGIIVITELVHVFCKRKVDFL